MARKTKQNIVIIDKELTPTIIGKLDTKEKSPALLIIVFIIFIAVAIFLPDITNYVDNYLNGNNKNTNINPNNNPVKDDNEVEEKPSEEEIVYYDYKEDLSINYESFTMSNIIVSENKLYFDLKNNSNEQLNLEDNKYFLEIYSSDTTLIGRIKISYGTISANATKNYSYDIDENISNNIAKLLIVTKSEADYPEVTLTKDELNNGILVCTKGFETITYTFTNNELISINDIINYPISNTNEYVEELQRYQVLAATYNNYDGISATLIDNQAGFTYTILIELQDAQIANLENNNYYNYRALAKTVKFETESNGFSCN